MIISIKYIIMVVIVSVILGVYDKGIEKYAEWKTNEMSKIDIWTMIEGSTSQENCQNYHGQKDTFQNNNDKASEETVEQSTCSNTGNFVASPEIRTPSQLRITVNQRSGIVENIDDRKAWNQWIVSRFFNTSNGSKTTLIPGKYTFAYRSYVNYEETTCIKKRLYHLQTWLFGYIQPKPGTITVIAVNDTDMEEMEGQNDNDKNNDSIVIPSNNSKLYITLIEIVKLGWFTTITIEWKGYWNSKRHRIDWTYTQMLKHRGSLRHRIWKLYIQLVNRRNNEYVSNDEILSEEPYSSTKLTIKPDTSERLRQIPWELINTEDGMVVFRRGDIGFLVYDQYPIIM